MYSPLTLLMRTLLTPVIIRISRFTSCLPLLPLEQGMCIKIIHALVVQCCIGRHLCWGIVLVENVKKDYSCGGACRQASLTNLRTGSFSMAVFSYRAWSDNVMNCMSKFTSWKRLEAVLSQLFECVHEKTRQKMIQLKSPTPQTCTNVGFREKHYCNKKVGQHISCQVRGTPWKQWPFVTNVCILISIFGLEFVQKSNVKMHSTWLCFATISLKTQIFILTEWFEFSSRLHLKYSAYFVML